MRKFGMIGLAAVTALALAGCKSTSSNGNMGATSGACSKGEACCQKEKAAMGAVSAEKSCSATKSECSSSKGSMGAVSGQSSCSKSCNK